MGGRGSYPGQTSRVLEPEQAANSLRNVLELERKLEFSDRAVMGGLDRFIERASETLNWIRDIEPLRGTS